MERSQMVSPSPLEQLFKGMVDYEVRFGRTASFVNLVDLTQIEMIRSKYAKENRPTYSAFVLKAMAQTLKELPYANRRFARRIWRPIFPFIQQFVRIDLGVAVETNVSDSLSASYVDILRDVDHLTLEEIHNWLKDRKSHGVTSNSNWSNIRRLTKYPYYFSKLLMRIPYMVPLLWEKYRGGAAVLSSPSKYGVDMINTCWSWPLGVSYGWVEARPMVKEGSIQPVVSFYLTMNFDRRIMAGAPAGRFFKRMTDLLENMEIETN